jgi:hypothetical protein
MWFARWGVTLGVVLGLLLLIGVAYGAGQARVTLPPQCAKVVGAGAEFRRHDAQSWTQIALADGRVLRLRGFGTLPVGTPVCVQGMSRLFSFGFDMMRLPEGACGPP